MTLSHKRGLTPNELPPRALSPTSSHSSESSDEIDKAEEEERRQEEEDAVGRRLKELEKMMSSDTLGFARPPRLKPGAVPSAMSQRSPLRESIQPGDSTGNSGATSPQGSIPSIPSPPPDSQSQSSSQAMSSTQAALPANAPLRPPPRLNPQPHRGVSIVRAHPSQIGSGHGSSASSFSDLSDAASVSASALESALMSNIRGGGSRLYVSDPISTSAVTDRAVDPCLRVATLARGVEGALDINNVIRCAYITNDNCVARSWGMTRRADVDSCRCSVVILLKSRGTNAGSQASSLGSPTRQLIACSSPCTQHAFDFC